MVGEPCIRALWGRTVLRRRARFTPAELAAWSALVSPELVARVEAAFPMQWLPAPDVLKLVDATRVVLGERYVSTGIEHLLGELGRPPFSAILRGIAHAASGHERRAVGAAIEVMFSTICRDAGTMVVEVDTVGDLSIWHRHPAPAFADSPGYRLAFSYVTLAALSVVGLTGRTDGFISEGEHLVCRVTDLRRGTPLG